MSLYAALKGKGPSGFGYGSTAEEVTEGLDLTGQTHLLTGCNSGIGLETLRVLGLRGAHLLAAARTEEKASAALSGAGAEGSPLSCELSDPASVRACVSTVRELGRPLDSIICNAGIMALPRLQQKEGHELQLFTNHVGHFMLVTGLLEQLGPEGRVVVVSSAAHKSAPSEGIQFDNLGGERSYKPWRAYGQSKLANVLFARALHRRLAKTGRSAAALHPGVIRTNLGRHMNPLARATFALAGPLVLKSIPQGAATQTYLAARPEVELGGKYFADCNPAPTSQHGTDDAMADKLWEVSEQIVAGL